MALATTFNANTLTNLVKLFKVLPKLTKISLKGSIIFEILRIVDINFIVNFVTKTVIVANVPAENIDVKASLIPSPPF